MLKRKKKYFIGQNILKITMASADEEKDRSSIYKSDSNFESYVSETINQVDFLFWGLIILIIQSKSVITNSVITNTRL